MKFDGTAWNLVDTSASPGLAWDVSMDIDSKDIPYIGFRDIEVHPPRASVVKYITPNWGYLGTSGFSQDDANETLIAVRNDKIYVLYTDYSADNNLTVMKYTISMTNQVILAPIINYLLN